MLLSREGLAEGEIALRETLFHTANGYLGLRACFEEGVPDGVRSVRGTYINGFYASAPIFYEERLHGFAKNQQSMANLPDAQGMGVTLSGETFSCFEGQAERFEQTLDTRKGTYARSLEWTSPDGRKTALAFRRLASFDLPQLALIRLEITPLNWCGEIEVSSTLQGDVTQDFDPNDPRKAHHGKKLMDVVGLSAKDGTLTALVEARGSGLRAACAVTHRWEGDIDQEVSANAQSAIALLKMEAAAAQTLRLTKYCVYTDSRRFPAPLASARELLESAAEHPFAFWAMRQEEYLGRFRGETRCGIEGNDLLDASLEYSAYCLLSSAGQDGVGNVSSKGLSGEGYEGHYFWDTEIYVFPFILLTRPQAARALLESRALMLGEARLHAREMGHPKGALYAWRTIAGAECSSYFPSGSAQYHINGAVAHAFLDYWSATGDLAFMERTGLPVLLDTARLWLDAGHWHQGAFRIDSVTGPDEYSCVVNNNYYTNRSAQAHLRGLLRLLEALKGTGKSEAELGFEPGEPEEFSRAAEGMYLPLDAGHGILAQDDAFLRKQELDLGAIPKERFPLLMHYHPLFLYRHQVCKQADAVLAMMLYEDGIPPEVMRATYTYYEKRTTHDSSLSECVFSIMAARIGDTEKAFGYYRRSAALDLENTHGNTGDGIHAANMGGCWMGVAYGFGGLRIGESGLSFRPCLPGGIDGYSFTLRWRGSRAVVKVSRDGIQFDLTDGAALPVRVYGETHRLAGTLRLPLA